jgi:hypothetical protein
MFLALQKQWLRPPLLRHGMTYFFSFPEGHCIVQEGGRTQCENIKKLFVVVD